MVRIKKGHIRRSFELGQRDEKRMGTRLLASSEFNLKQQGLITKSFCDNIRLKVQTDGAKYKSG